MKSEHQDHAINLLAEVWALSPEVRLGQLISHLGVLSEAHRGQGLGYIEDDELLNILKLHRDELRARSTSAANSALTD